MKIIRIICSAFFLVCLGGSISSSEAANNPANIPAVSSITALRALPAVQYPNVYLTQYNATTGIGGGEFTLSSACASDDGGVCIKAVGGYYRRNTNGQPFNIAWFGAQCGGVQVTDGVSTGTTTITSASAEWTAAMVGSQAVVNKAASGNNQLVTTVSGFNNSGSITLATTTSSSNTGETVTIYPDDTTAIDDAIAAANAAAVPWTLPSRAKCGFANPGSLVQKNLYTDVHLNGGTLWLGQTGPTTDYGVSLAWLASDIKLFMEGGSLDGLYQTNQGIAQFDAAAAIFSNTPGTLSGNAIVGPGIIENTKGRCWLAGVVTDFHADKVTWKNCGDYIYQHSSTPGDMYGRSMGAQISSPIGGNFVSNYNCYMPAQSCLLIDDFGGNSSANDSVELSNGVEENAGYYGSDNENFPGTIHSVNKKVISTLTPSGALINGGVIYSNVAEWQDVNVTTEGIDADAFVAEDPGNIIINGWSLVNANLIGTATNHAGELYINFQWNSVADSPERVLLNRVNYDTAEFFISGGGNACSTAKPRQQLLSFKDINASQQLGSGYDTTFAAQANSGSFIYILGRDSNLGTVAVDTLGTNVDWALFDVPGVQTNGAWTFTGNTASAAYGTSTNNPTTSFTCPS